MAVKALDDLKEPSTETPLFPDSQGKPVTKFHMVTAWTKHVDEEMSGHSARRSGAMRYARQGMSVQSIQFLGRWKSSAVFRYIEEAMTEIPMNMATYNAKPESVSKISEEVTKRKALRPKATAKAKQAQEEEESPASPPKQLVSDSKQGPVYAVSRSRGGWTKHIVGQAA